MSKVLSLIITTLFSISINAGITCHTPRLNKNFEINGNKVTFLKATTDSPNRELASLNSRNKLDSQKTKSINKIVEFENQKHTIHIEDSGYFSDVNDYLIIRNKTGHEIIYPLTCSLK